VCNAVLSVVKEVVLSNVAGSNGCGYLTIISIVLLRMVPPQIPVVCYGVIFNDSAVTVNCAEVFDFVMVNFPKAVVAAVMLFDIEQLSSASNLSDD
jgi:hypothetical protein